MERFALIEAVAQFTRALDQVASLPATPAQRREQIQYQVGLANALYHTNGFAAALGHIYNDGRSSTAIWIGN